MKTPPPRTSAPVPNLEFKAALLLALFVALVLGTVLYLMYARGSFEETQRLVLVTDDSEGVRVGMDLTFAGFPIGRVHRIELAPDGAARIVVDVLRRDAHWLRESSVFILLRSLVGGVSLKAYSGVLTDPPLPDGAQRKVLVGDTNAELPLLVSNARELLQNLTRLSATDSALAASLDNLHKLDRATQRAAWRRGCTAGQRCRAHASSPPRWIGSTCCWRAWTALPSRPTRRCSGPSGLVQETRATVLQLNAMLGDARDTLKRVDAVLAEAQAVAANTRVATTDLGALRTEVDATVRKVEQLVDEVNRKWPFARDTELKLR